MVRAPTLRWLVLAAATVAATVAAGALNLPSPSLFGALVVGLAYALAGGVPLGLAAGAVGGAQAVVGVALGTYVSLSTLTEVGAHWAPVLAVTVATLALSVAGGLAVARYGHVDRATASLGMIAGGASGIVAMSDELGADDRLVAIMQYLRVLIIVVLAPVLFPLWGGGHAGVGGGGAHAATPLAAGLALTLGASVIGALAGRWARVPAGSLLGPLILTSALTLSGVTADARVPVLVQDVAFAVIGMQVGLRFTPDSLRRAGRLLPLVLTAIVGLIVGCGLLALPLAPLAGVSPADAYLATTPGGLYAVLATAVGGGANTTFVLSVQALRLLVMILAAPPLIRLLLRSGGGPGAGAPPRLAAIDQAARGEHVRGTGYSCPCNCEPRQVIGA